jgi:hypothetical protein
MSRAPCTAMYRDEQRTDGERGPVSGTPPTRVQTASSLTCPHQAMRSAHTMTDVGAPSGSTPTPSQDRTPLTTAWLTSTTPIGHTAPSSSPG